MKWGRIFLACLWICAIATSASATVTANSIVTTQNPKAYKAQVVNASGVVTLTATTNYVTVVTGGANGTKVVSLVCTSNDAASHNIAYGFIRSATFYPLGVAAIGSASATSVTSVNLLASGQTSGLAVDSDGNPYVLLESTDTLVAGVLTTAVTASDAVSCMATAADF